MRISKAVGRLAVTMKLMALLCALVILPFGSFVLRADAAEGKANLTVNWDQKNQELVLYRVAVRNSDGSYTLTDDFKDYGVDILNADEKQLENAAELLAAYATRDKLEPLNKLKTDGTGKYTFSDLDYGAYMVFNKATVEGNTTSAVPVFVYLEKDMEVQIKPLDEVTTSCKVYKIWDDNDSKDRPDSIVIQLLNEDGSVRDEQTLSGKNNWYYAWTNLPEGKYKVVEKKVPSGYSLSASRLKETWKLTNKKKTKSTQPSGSTPSGGEKNPPGNSKKIPQTGQLWWPVPILASAGFLCMIIGLLRRRKKDS